MSSTYRDGSLYVVETPRDRNAITQDLRAIDPRLFVERQITLEQEAVWCVVVEVGGDQPPITILEYRDSDDRPIAELSSGIVERMRKMERESGGLTAKVIKHNRDRIERARHEARQAWEEIGAEFEQRMSPTYSAVLHRGQYLRRSRDRRRARGEQV